MRRTRILVFALLVAAVALAGFLILKNLGNLGASPLPEVKAVPQGDQEIAWIHAATSGANWDRFVAAVYLVKESHPELGLEIEERTPQSSAGIPEIALRVKGCDQRLWIRWYKLTSATGTGYWVKKLAERDPPPLAIIGGWSTDRAFDLARELTNQPQWHGAPPLFLITTATADQVPGDQDTEAGPPTRQDLMDVHRGRTFRFCFTNKQMAEALVDFVWNHPTSLLRPHGDRILGEGLTTSAVACLAAGDVWGGLAFLAAAAEVQQPTVYTVEWKDDPYSLDLSERFHEEFRKPDKKPNRVRNRRIPHSVGDYHRPNRWEAETADWLMDEIARDPGQHPLLVVPATIRSARRFVRAMTLSAPVEIRRTIIVSGDSITFNSIYRDRKSAWSAQDFPVPLIFFCHENPVFTPPPNAPQPPSAADFSNTHDATDDLLLNALIVGKLLESAYRPVGGQEGQKQLVSSADELAKYLHDTQPPFFDAKGNRIGGSGEYVVYLRPHITDEGRVLPEATIEVWVSTAGAAPGRRGPWRLQDCLTVTYGQGSHAQD